MTREEAKRISISTPRGLDHHVAIDKIYDDFENRTCENCKYMDFTRSNFCRYLEKSIKVDDISDGFGCNKWESKRN